MKKWYKLDNAAKLFPSVTNFKYSAVFRISVLLKDKVDEVILQQSINSIYERFPMFTVSLRRGVFWNYFDSCDEIIEVEEEQDYPCKAINFQSGKESLFKVLYYENRISIEVFHSITDGSGAIEFLKSLLYYYLKHHEHSLEHEEKIILGDTVVGKYELEDSFLKYHKDCYVESLHSDKSYQIKGTPFEQYGNNVIHGIVSASKLNKIAKNHGATITSYLTAILIYSIYHSRVKHEKKNEAIVVSVPVNLRQRFPSRTLRNFFGVVNLGAKIDEKTDISRLSLQLTEMLKYKTSKENLQNIIYNNVNMEQKKAAPFIPLIIKKWFVQLGFTKLGENKRTMTLSNLGNINLPTKMYEYIEHIEAVVYPSAKSPISCGICSVNDKLTITFARNIIETDILQHFFTFLAEDTNLDVCVYSNEWGIVQ
ncbi:hypothetical protein [Bacillus massiliigorillae]|uniref:hypothetical protein n=1 Tax=Bacillus massiliigorillae TaxID=1243664 RepID=UPI0003A342D8|nr:hypothetical protein [Bacillus massiliigorillae]